jgi:DNA-binding XRE family transcriptional regulator
VTTKESATAPIHGDRRRIPAGEWTARSEADHSPPERATTDHRHVSPGRASAFSPGAGLVAGAETPAVRCTEPGCARGATVLCPRCRRAVCARCARPAWVAADVVLCVSCFARSADLPAPLPLPGLRAARGRAAFTQGRLAARAGLSTGTVSNSERGRPASLPTLQKLATALGVEPRALTEPPAAPAAPAPLRSAPGAPPPRTPRR